MECLIVILDVFAIAVGFVYFCDKLLSLGEETSLNEQQECLKEDARLRAEKRKAREEKRKKKP